MVCDSMWPCTSETNASQDQPAFRVLGHCSMRKPCSFLDIVTIFGISVQDVLHNDTTTTVERDKDVLDLFCGEAAIHRAAVVSGFASAAFDKFRVPGVTDRRRLHAGIASGAPFEKGRLAGDGATLLFLRDVERRQLQAQCWEQLPGR